MSRRLGIALWVVAGLGVVACNQSYSSIKGIRCPDDLLLFFL